MAGTNWLIFGMQPPIGTKLTKMGAVGKKKVVLRGVSDAFGCEKFEKSRFSLKMNQ